MAMNANDMVSSISSEDEDMAKKEAIAFNTQKFKAQIIKIQLKQSTNFNHSIRLLKQLKTTIEKMEDQLN